MQCHFTRWRCQRISLAYSHSYGQNKLNRLIGRDPLKQKAVLIGQNWIVIVRAAKSNVQTIEDSAISNRIAL